MFQRLNHNSNVSRSPLLAFVSHGIAVILVAAAGFGCAHSARVEDGVADREAVSGAPLEVQAQGKARDDVDRLGNPREMIVNGIKLQNTQFDIPVRVNTLVEQWVDYFTGKGRKYYELYLARSEFFVPYIVPLLKTHQMPEDLVYLAMIESGFNNHARSHAKAVGPWQFISATGKRYGLAVNWWVDERRDIEKSTMAAIQYLKELHGMFGTWELAASAYNSGEAKVGRAIQRYGTRDFWVLSRHRFFRPETRHYVPKMIAAAIVSKNRTQFGFPQRFNKSVEELEGEALAAETSLSPEAKQASESIDPSELNAKAEPLPLPQALSSDAAEADVGAAVHVAVEGPSLVPAALVVARDSVHAVPTPHVSKKGELGGDRLLEFEVQSPADLEKIAKASGMPYLVVKSFNPEIRRWCTPPTTRTYRIKLPESVKDRFLTAYNHPAFPRGIRFRTYEVRSGDNLQKIARRFGINEEPIQDLNGMRQSKALSRGTKVLLPIPNDGARSFSTLELIDRPNRRKKRRIRAKRASRPTVEARVLKSSQSVTGI